MSKKTRKQQLENVEEITKLDRQRIFIQNKVSNIKTFLSNFDDRVHGINNLKILKPALERCIESHEKNTERLLEIVSETEVEKVTQDSYLVDNLIREVQSKLCDLLDQLMDDTKSQSSFCSADQDITVMPVNGLPSSTMIQPIVTRTDVQDSISDNLPQDSFNITHVNQPLPITGLKDRLNNPNISSTYRLNPLSNPQPNINSGNIQSSEPKFQTQNIPRTYDHNEYRGPISNVQHTPTYNVKPTPIQTPVLDIPIFDGNPLNWLIFKQMFVSIIHNRPDLDDVIKFSYLLKHLSGKAVSGLGYITLSSVGYTQAWQHLLSEYDNNCILVDTHIDNILSLPYCNKENPIELRKLLNACQLHVSTLIALNFNIDQLSERMLINIVKKRLDAVSRKLWEEQQHSNQFSSWNDMVCFIQRRCQILESLESCKTKPFNEKKVDNNSKFAQKSSGSKTFSVTSTANNSSSDKEKPDKQSFSQSENKVKKYSCYVCKKNHHSIYNCLKFLKFDIQERIKLIKQNRACLNCLQIGHWIKDCTSKNTCKICQNKHNSLLHNSTSKSSEQVCVAVGSSESSRSISNNIVHAPTDTLQSNLINELERKTFVQDKSSNSVLLSTAVILISNSKGLFQPCRVLLDSGSQSNFISKSFSDKLKLPKMTSNTAITLLNDNKTNVSHKISSQIKSRLSNFNQTIELEIVPTITDNFPSNTINVSRWSIPNDISLADPFYNIPSPIDVLLGADIYYQILKLGKIHKIQNQPILLETQFGWIFGGSYDNKNCFNFNTSLNDSNVQSADILDSLLPKFWDITDMSQQKHISDEEQQCEEHFASTHKRDENGRFVIRLPFKENVSQLGESKYIAQKRFHYLEQKFRVNENLKVEYTKFIHEYLNLNHMKLINENNDSTDQKMFYLPHHCVVKPTSSTTKLRVVFDASVKSKSGLSLNDVLCVGPVIQDNLFAIVLRFRKHNVVFTTDIKKMYRQIQVDKTDTPYQRILWRDDVDQPIGTYELTTVTYGTACAPYIATKALNQLAIDESTKFPAASKTVIEDFYVDDLLTGSETVEQARCLQRDILSLLEKGGFGLHKWSSNSYEFMQSIPEEDREVLHINEVSGNESIKTLGLIWQPIKDVFSFNIEPLRYDEKLTKRSLLSSIAKLYDPLGLLSPVIIVAKLLVQNLWKCKLNWDDSISEHDQKTWISFRENLNCLQTIEFDRQIVIPGYDTVEMHGFSDASQSAYGACLYIKCIKNNQVSVRLLCSKSRVAPLKTISIARLELCAALLLCQLVKNSLDSLHMDFNNIQLWTDSEIVRAWIATPPYKLKTFVANRVSEIQLLFPNIIWNHVSSSTNPADLISRGVMPQFLENNVLWWNGPSFLKTYSIDHQLTPTNLDNFEIPELKSEYEISEHINLNTVTDKKSEFHLLTKFSCFNKLIRVTSLIFRFYFNCKNKTNRKSDVLSCDEINKSILCIVRLIQKFHFGSDIDRLSKNHQLLNTSNIRNLNPFLDENGILRVGGRIRNSDYDYNMKHQILLPQKHHVTDLILRDAHVKNHHAGPNLLVSIIRQNYWPINAKQRAKKIVRSCVVCFKFRPTISTQIMGDLPKDRIEPGIPFNITGVDFCGPFMIKNKFQRKSPIIKMYVSLFVCFVTKAIHLEIVSSLTSEAFIACLKRFIARRGRCSKLYSDNGKNFVGAYNILRKEYTKFLDEDNYDKINKFLITEHIDWKFIPPRSPNFGGLWESSVKLFKTHLKKVVGETVLYYEELNTIVIEIEGILNSRPLYPLSSDPNDPQVLTPGHFLRGAPLTALPQPSITETAVNCLTRWQRVKQMVQLFWKKYSVEYLHHLQTRYKWKSANSNIHVGDICLIRDANIVTSHWIIGRVIEISKGTDNKVRVVKLRTRMGEIVRSISSICPLPIEDNNHPDN